MYMYMYIHTRSLTSKSVRVSKDSSQFSVVSWFMSAVRDFTQVTDVSVTNTHIILHKSYNINRKEENYFTFF